VFPTKHKNKFGANLSYRLEKNAP